MPGDRFFENASRFLQSSSSHLFRVSSWSLSQGLPEHKVPCLSARPENPPCTCTSSSQIMGQLSSATEREREGEKPLTNLKARSNKQDYKIATKRRGDQQPITAKTTGCGKKRIQKMAKAKGRLRQLLLLLVTQHRMGLLMRQPAQLVDISIWHPQARARLVRVCLPASRNLSSKRGTCFY